MSKKKFPISSSIYSITNLINGKMYIGSTVNTNVRWLKHKRELLNGTHHSNKLQRAFNKYGVNINDDTKPAYAAPIYPYLITHIIEATILTTALVGSVIVNSLCLSIAVRYLPTSGFIPPTILETDIMISICALLVEYSLPIHTSKNSLPRPRIPTIISISVA